MLSHNDVLISTSDDPPQELARLVDEGLEEFNFSVAPLHDVRRLGAFARDPSDVVVGGAVGRTWGQCCELLQLWVRPEARRSGTGTLLLRAFEERARARGCRVFYLTTLSFQAPQFYRRAGYDVLASISGYPDGIVKYLMHKTEA